MQRAVKEKLDRIDDLFPADRLRASKERWRRNWAGEPPLDRYPFVYSPIALGYYCAGKAPGELLHDFLDEIIVRGQAQDDFIPTIFPGCKQSTLPNMFGARDVRVGDDWTCDRVVMKADDVFSLPEAAIAPGSVAQEWLDLQRWLLEETEGRMPIHVVDMQGPADVCGQLWGYEELLLAALEMPDAYHAIMRKATDAFILFWEAQRDLLGEQFVGTHLLGWDWVPPGIGATVSADSLVMVSPAFYQEFYRPCLRRIADHFGGVTVHSCGQFPAVIPGLCATPGLRGINAGQMTVPDLLAAGMSSAQVIIAYLPSLDDAEATFALVRERALRVNFTVSGFWPETDKPVAEWGEDEFGIVRERDGRFRDCTRC